MATKGLFVKGCPPIKCNEHAYQPQYTLVIIRYQKLLLLVSGQIMKNSKFLLRIEQWMLLHRRMVQTARIPNSGPYLSYEQDVIDMKEIEQPCIRIELINRKINKKTQ